MVTTISNFWKIFRYGVKRDHYDKSISIREFSERHALDFFDNPFSTDTRTPQKNITPVDEFNDG